MVRMAETNESSFFECSKIQQIYLTQCVLFLIFETPWTVGCQAPLSTGFPRQGCWSGLPFPSPGDLPEPGIELTSAALGRWVLYHRTTWGAHPTE